MNHARTLIVAALGSLGALNIPEYEIERRPATRARGTWRGPSWKIPRPRRYFGGRQGRKLTRRLRMQLGKNP